MAETESIKQYYMYTNSLKGLSFDISGQIKEFMATKLSTSQDILVTLDVSRLKAHGIYLRLTELILL